MKPQAFTKSFLLILVVIGIGVLLSTRGSEFIISKFIFGYLLLILVLLSLGCIERNKSAHEILKKYEDLEKLLLDLRNGTRQFHKEKRKFDRKSCVMLAKLPGREKAQFMKVIDISYSGALLRSAQQLQAGEIMKFNLYLPIFVQPIDIAAKVVRVSPAIDENQQQCFDVGIEYLNISTDNRERLFEVLDLLNNKSNPS